ncbi:DUF4124 domain-containing protein [Moritella sp. JT01]|uniref:DUF4124 domain-containing protein n=1 Tax=Moritella sp. JT01 TaxID=756698 RepID=UPI001D17318F|nr:DUF4124 domain-containing protein [Moritella sp. JT01]
MSYSTFAKVYSWRDTDGAMHYSQFPRQIVEKNAAQSRASRKPVEMKDIVNDLSATKNSNLLDGLDDIIANASVERQVEKVLTRRDPQLILIEQQLVRQQAKLRALVIAKQAALEKEIALVAANNIIEINHIKPKKKSPQNSFMAGIHKRAYGNAVTKTNGVHVITPTLLASTTPKDSTVIENVGVKQQHNKFLAKIQNKLKRQHVPEAVQISPSIAPIVVVNAKPKPLIKPVELIAATYILAPVVESRSIAKVKRKNKSTATNAFLAGINKKLNRKDKTLTIDEAVFVANKSELSRGNKLQVTAEQVQNKFLAEINKKLFRARLGSDITPVAELAKSESITHAKGQGRATVKNKELTQSADQIKAIESEISSRSHKSNDVKQPSEKQVNSALMLSRLSYNHDAGLPLSRAGMSQLDRQGIDVSSQFVNDVNRSAE